MERNVISETTEMSKDFNESLNKRPNVSDINKSFLPFYAGPSVSSSELLLPLQPPSSSSYCRSEAVDQKLLKLKKSKAVLSPYQNILEADMNNFGMEISSKTLILLQLNQIQN